MSVLGNRRALLIVIGVIGIFLVTTQTFLRPTVLPINRYGWASALLTGGISAIVPSSSSLSSRSLGKKKIQHDHGTEPEYKYRAYPFHFSCPAHDEPTNYHSNLTFYTPYKVAIVYHVVLVNNWRDILYDQLLAITRCGLGAIASELILSVCAKDDSSDVDGIDALKVAVADYMSDLVLSIKTEIIGSRNCNDNSLGLTEAQSYCVSTSPSTKHRHIVFHLHNGGASQYHLDWYIHKKTNDEGSYSRSLYWRKYAEHFVIERPFECLSAILNDGALSCGVNLRTRESDTIKGDNAHNTTLQSLAYAEDIWAVSCPVELPRPGNASKKKHMQLHRTKKDRTKRLIHQEEYDEGALNPRFKLTCPIFQPNKYQNVDLTLAYHIGFLNNWRDVVTDQVSTITSCGLGAALKSIIISHSNATQDNLSEVTKMISERRINAPIQFVVAHSMPYEGPIMNAMHKKCQAADQKTIVFYLHNKGVSRYRSDWKAKGDVDKPSSDWKMSPYAFLLYWRKYMEYFTIERPQLCIDAILNGGAWACGVNMRPTHYSGNVFVADCDYVRELTPVTGTGYLDAEAFIGQRMNKDAFLKGRFVNLHEAPPAGKAGYRHLMLPEEYRKDIQL